MTAHTPITPSVIDAAKALCDFADRMAEDRLEIERQAIALDAKWSARSRVYHDRQENGRG